MPFLNPLEKKENENQLRNFKNNFFIRGGIKDPFSIKLKLQKEVEKDMALKTIKIEYKLLKGIKILATKEDKTIMKKVSELLEAELKEKGVPIE